jgi:hypothetical protein
MEQTFFMDGLLMHAPRLQSQNSPAAQSSFFEHSVAQTPPVHTLPGSGHGDIEPHWGFCASGTHTPFEHL